MPKVQPTDREIDLGTVRGIIMKYLNIRCMTYRNLGFPQSTWSTKIRNPDKFTRAELHRICKKLQIPAEEKVMMI